MTKHISQQDYIFVQAAAIRRCAAADLIYFALDDDSRLLLRDKLIERMEGRKRANMIMPWHRNMSDTLKLNMDDAVCCVSHELLSEVIEIMEVKEITDREKTLSMDDLLPKMMLMDIAYPEVLLLAAAEANKAGSLLNESELKEGKNKGEVLYKVRQMKGQECEQIDIFRLDREARKVSPMWHYSQSEGGGCPICSVLELNITLNKKTDMELIINV